MRRKPLGPSLPIDRRFARVLGPGQKARIQVASGTHDRKLWAELNVMLDQFAERQPGLLEEIRDHQLTPLQAYHELWLSGKWLRFTGRTAHARSLVRAVETWAQRTQRKLSERTREARLVWAAWLHAHARSGATLADLPGIMEHYRDTCEDADTASAFNHSRAYARAFLRDTVKKSDPLYLAIADMGSLRETPKMGRHPQTRDGAHRIATALGPRAGGIWLTMCYTGMGPKELWEDGYEIDYSLQAVRILGRKTPKRRRLVPLVAYLGVPKLTREGFKSALRRSGLGVAPYDARRTFSVWMVEAGIPSNRRDYYRGHAPMSMGQLYEQPDDSIRNWLLEDGERLRNYLGLGKPGLALMG